MLNRLALSAALVATASPALAQNVQTRTLSKPDAEFSEPFTQIGGLRELKDGRVIVVDPRDKVVQVVDMKAGTATKLGREGGGPGEYGLPFSLMALPNDTTAIADILNNRLLLINPNATVGGFVDLNVPPPAGARGGGGMLMIGASMPTAADARGRMYVRGAPFRMTDQGPQSADSVPMIRWDRKSGKRDTVAWLRLPASANQVTSSGGRGNQQVRVRMGGGPPFNGADQMVVGPDGRIAIAHHDPYSVDFVTETGQRVRGQPIRYDRQRISEGHKAEWRERQKTATGLTISNDNGRRSATMGPAGQQQDPEVWGGEFMPPFLPVNNTLTFSNDGYLWIQRTGPAGQPPTFDVIDRAGNLALKVVLPKRSRLVGFGNGTVYTARFDEDDLQYLQKHRFTMPDRP
ncbi:MAG TPA: hypothetical protein VFD64_00235 [Gemmatimonadaceae bacterium]|nr:hypothetical protein [Gemmatimonadaceae bacterium]